MTVGTALPDLEPLDLKCTNSDCENDLHCFLRKTKRKDPTEPKWGPCRACGEDLVDFPRVQARDIGDVKNTFKSLRREWIRHMLWHASIDQHAINHARRKGRRQLLSVDVPKRLRQSVGKARNVREGRQTPFHGNVIFYAQHAVAACCRRCIEYWHGIPMGKALKRESIDYLSALVSHFIDERLPDLKEEPIKVAPIRKAKPKTRKPGTAKAGQRNRTPTAGHG